MTSVPWTKRLPLYKIPDELFTFLNERQQNLVPEAGRRFLPQQLTPETYVQMFEVLLWCEESKISYASPIELCVSTELKKYTQAGFGEV